jgi:Vitamin K-dependent gamma-carboxylase
MADPAQLVDPFSLHGVVMAWNMFFHAPASPLPLAVFRFAFGAVLFVESLGLLRWGADLYGHGGIRGGAGRADGARVTWIFRLHTLSCLCLTLGLGTRLAAALVFVHFCFRTRRNWLLIQGGDNVAKFMSLLLVFSNAGGVLSLDHLLHWDWLGGSAAPTSQWAMRLMQIQICLIYLRTVCWKLRVKEWLEGSAVFHALYRNRSLRPFLRRPVMQSALAYAPVAAFLTWGTLAAETFVGVFLWFRETRLIALTVAVTLHVGFELGLAIKYFQWLMMAGLLLFVSPERLARLVAVIGLAT